MEGGPEAGQVELPQGDLQPLHPPGAGAQRARGPQGAAGGAQLQRPQLQARRRPAGLQLPAAQGQAGRLQRGEDAPDLRPRGGELPAEVHGQLQLPAQGQPLAQGQAEVRQHGQRVSGQLQPALQGGAAPLPAGGGLAGELRVRQAQPEPLHGQQAGIRHDRPDLPLRQPQLAGRGVQDGRGQRQPLDAHREGREARRDGQGRGGRGAARGGDRDGARRLRPRWRGPGRAAPAGSTWTRPRSRRGHRLYCRRARPTRSSGGSAPAPPRWKSHRRIVVNRFVRRRPISTGRPSMLSSRRSTTRRTMASPGRVARRKVMPAGRARRRKAATASHQVTFLRIRCYHFLP